MRVLMIAPAYAPYFFSEALVNAKLGLAMQRAGWDVTVLTARNSGFVYSDSWSEPWQALESSRIEVPAPGTHANRLSRISGRVSTILRGIDPIPGARWAEAVAKEGLRRHADRPFDMILSRSTSCIAHLPAMLFRQEERVPWIANYNDPPAFMKPDVYAEQEPALNRLLLMRYLRRSARMADFCSFPSWRLRDFLWEPLGLKDNSKTLIAPHVRLALPEETGTASRVSRCDAPFVVTHAGSLLPEHEPRLLLEAWKRFADSHATKNPVLQLIGFVAPENTALIDELSLGKSVKLMGPMPFLDTLEVLARSNLQLIVDRRHHGTLMLSKIPDYASAGRPILAIAPADSTTRDMICDYGAGLWAGNDDSAGIEEAFANALVAAQSTIASFSVEALRDVTSPERALAQIEEVAEACRVSGGSRL